MGMGIGKSYLVRQFFYVSKWNASLLLFKWYNFFMRLTASL
jgi:hypothetical protein